MSADDEGGRYRRLALAGGLLALALGALAVAAPGLVPVSTDRAVLSLIALIAVLGALRAVQSRRKTNLRAAETPDPELSARVGPPGEPVETAAAEFLDGARERYARSNLRDGLREAAVATLVQYDGRSEAEARELLADGSWTDDERAAAFLGDAETAWPPLGDRLRSVIGGEAAFDRSVRHAVDAVATVAGVGATADDTDAAAEPGGPTTEAVDDRRTTERWRGAGAVALAAIGVGVLARRPAVLLAAAVGVGYVAYARAFDPPEPELSVERELDDDRPAPGDRVTVTLAVTNEGEGFLPDLRVVDGVPSALSVAEGSPRAGFALRPGETGELSYEVLARRGVHEFGPTLSIARDVAGRGERETSVSVGTTLSCVPPLPTPRAGLALREPSTPYVGRIDTDVGGEGIAFHATREYRTGDPVNRVDWKRRARTGELTTVEFREERLARVVVLIDAREPAFVAPGPDRPHAVDRAVEAAGYLYAGLTAAGNRVGIAAVGDDDCWLAPGAGEDHRTAARTLLATHPALSPLPGETALPWSLWARRFRKRLSAGTQVVFVSPLTDDYARRLVRRLDEAGFPTTVLSPDPTVGSTPGTRLARVARSLRVAALRSARVPVVDWPAETAIGLALARHGEREGR